MPDTSAITFNISMLDAYEAGSTSDISGLSKIITDCSSPAAAFACLAAYYSGQEETKLNDAMNEYEEQSDIYTETLEWSQYTAESKCAAANAENRRCKYSTEFHYYIAVDPGNPNKTPIMTDEQFSAMAHNADGGNLDEDTWQGFCDVLNEEKDIQSTELNKLSTTMEMTIQDSSDAQEMAANAVKKISDLASAMANSAGG